MTGAGLLATIAFICGARGTAEHDPLSRGRDEFPTVGAVEYFGTSEPLVPDKSGRRRSGLGNAPPALRAAQSADSIRLLRTFEGIGVGLGVSRTSPLDPNGDVGPLEYVQIVNGFLAIFDKSGNVLFGPEHPTVLWKSTSPTACASSLLDPMVLYDPIADRWVLMYIPGYPPRTAVCVAVSATDDPAGAYHRYSIAFAEEIDYPKIGVWPDAYYLAMNKLGERVCALERDAMLEGRPARRICFESVGLPVDFDGTSLPSPGTPAYFIELDPYTIKDLRIRTFHADWNDPTRSSYELLEQLQIDPQYIGPPLPDAVPQPGTAQRLSWDRGLRPRQSFRRFADHDAVLLTSTTYPESRTGIRWTELRFESGIPYVYQQGTYAPDEHWRFESSGAIDRHGNVAIGYSVSSATIFPSIRVAGRRPTDLLGQMSLGETVLAAGSASQTNQIRWGDYTTMGVDPVDDCTFWYVNQYLREGEQYLRTRIGAFALPGCEPAPVEYRHPPQTERHRGGCSTTGPASVLALVLAAAPVRAIRRRAVLRALDHQC